MKKRFIILIGAGLLLANQTQATMAFWNYTCPGHTWTNVNIPPIRNLAVVCIPCVAGYTNAAVTNSPFFYCGYQTAHTAFPDFENNPPPPTKYMAIFPDVCESHPTNWPCGTVAYNTNSTDLMLAPGENGAIWTLTPTLVGVMWTLVTEKIYSFNPEPRDWITQPFAIGRFSVEHLVGVPAAGQESWATRGDVYAPGAIETALLRLHEFWRLATEPRWSTNWVQVARFWTDCSGAGSFSVTNITETTNYPGSAYQLAIP